MTTYYVTQGGTGDGSTYADACSVAELNANTHFTPTGGDTVYLCDTITSTVAIPSSGTSASSKVTYRGDYAGHAGVLDAEDTRDNCITSQGTDYITLDSLTLKNSVAMAISTLWSSVYWTINACTFENIGTYCMQFANSSNNGEVTDCTFTDWGLVDGNQYAIQVIGSEGNETGPIDVTGCTFTMTQDANETETTPVMADTRGWVRTFSNNTINGNSYILGSGFTTWRPPSIATTITVENNIISDVSSSGIMIQSLEYFGAAPTVSVKYNKLTNTCLGDALGVEALRLNDFTSNCNVTAAYNIINGTYNGVNPHDGIRAHGADAVKIYNNTVYSCDDGIQVLAEGADTSLGVDIRNNISTGNRGYGLNLEAGSTITGWGYNCWYDNDSGNLNGKAAGTGDVTDDPLLFNPGTDFHLKKGSPCINAGTDVDLIPTDDYDGNSVPKESGPDIGAYEYNSYPYNVTWNFTAS